MSRIPNAQQLQSYSVNRRGQVEAVRQSLYDIQTYAQAGQTQLNFFAVPKGQGTTSHPGSTGAKTYADTNMTTAGVLPSPIRYLVKSIEVMFYPGLTIGQFAAVASDVINFSDDVYNVSKSGYLDFVIGSKSYLTEAPIGRFPPKSRLETGHAAVASNSATTGALMVDYAAMGGRPYLLDAPLFLESNQNFSISLYWPNAVALATADTTARIGIVLDGYLYRLSQ